MLPISTHVSPVVLHAPLICALTEECILNAAYVLQLLWQGWWRLVVWGSIMRLKSSKCAVVFRTVASFGD